MNITEQLKPIVEKFEINQEYFFAESFGNGHINQTYAIYTKSANEPPTRYILQKINTDIFQKPVELMENVRNVTGFIRKKIEEEGGDPDRQTLTLVPTKSGEDFYHDEENGYFRVYKFIENTVSYDLATPELFYSSARAFGHFQKLLSTCDASSLHETLELFHHTPNRFENFKKAISQDPLGRAKQAGRDIEFALKREEDCSYIVERIEKGLLPLRVTHNDTKLNNVLIDKNTGKGVCVIDLDTVMPGSSLYDFGDSIRFGASSALEDEPDESKVYLCLDKYENYTRGFLEEVSSSLTKEELEGLPMGAKLMTFECGIRFLTDYLLGDTYFRIHREGQNLDRTRTQFRLVADMEKKWDEMHEIVKKYS